MNRKTRTDRIVIAAVLALVFAGSGITTVATAMNLSLAAPVYAASAIAAALCALAATSGVGAVAAAVLLAVTAGGFVLTHLDGFRAIPAFLSAWQGTETDPALVTMGANTFLLCAAVAFGAVFFGLICKRELTALAVMFLLAMLISSHAMSETASLPASLPGLAATAAAFALSGGIQRDAAAWRALVPVALALALAMAVLPGGRVTWRPMEELAERVRSVVEQYFNFTHERIAFSISEEGYNHGGEVNGQAVAMLGGPAQPDPEPVLRVNAGADLLLRGTIRTTYTGYSWVDITPKSRYLYYDLTHRGVRERVFNLNLNSPDSAFHAVSAEVELLDHGTSTLFVPGRMTEFNMDLANAVYYNSSGEMFLAREVAPGDRYSLTALVPEHGEALKQAALWAEMENDDQYAAVLAANTELPQGIDDGLYALTMQIIADAQNPCERAEAIAEYLRRNMRYRLDVEYPPAGRDFASWFVLESKQGYCSYFATAMAVMGRIAGLPTRYVEGYLARPGDGGEVVLTGWDAHAWAEVYLRGLGWIPYDATNGGPNSSGGASGGDGAGGNPDTEANGDGGMTTEETDAPGTPDMTPPPEGGQGNDSPDDSPEDEPEDAPQDQPEDQPQDPPEDSPEDAPEIWEDAPEEENGGYGAAWLFLLVILLLLLIALLALWVRRRLQATDPVLLCRRTRRSQAAAMIAYRANLTLLAQMGQGPVNGETPEAFVSRLAAQFDNPDYEAFVGAVARSRYGNRPLRKDDVEAGLRAYERFLNGLRPLERARYAVTRILHGLGDFESIP